MCIRAHRHHPAGSSYMNDGRRAHVLRAAGPAVAAPRPRPRPACAHRGGLGPAAPPGPFHVGDARAGPARMCACGPRERPAAPHRPAGARACARRGRPPGGPFPRAHAPPGARASLPAPFVCALWRRCRGVAGEAGGAYITSSRRTHTGQRTRRSGGAANLENRILRPKRSRDRQRRSDEVCALETSTPFPYSMDPNH